MLNSKPLNLKGKKAVVMGLGLYGGGVSSANFLIQQEAEVLVTDLKDRDQLKDSINKIKGKVDYVLGEHREGDFERADLIVRNPGVPYESEYLEIARKNGIPIEMEITLFLKYCRSKNVIGVTGSKGKSTTCQLIYEILKKAGKKVVLGGNIGISVLDQLSEIGEDTWVVLEISSWQIEGMRDFRLSPHIGVVTNVLREHQNRHKDMEDYAQTKKDLLTFQKLTNYAVVNQDNPYTKSFDRDLKSKVVYFGGEYIKANKNAARSVGEILKIDKNVISEVLDNFEGLPYRYEIIRKVNDITFINDTTATVPDAAIFAIKKTKDPVVLLAGGKDKELEFEEFGKLVNERKMKVVFIEGSATDKMEKVIDQELVLDRFTDFKEAILAAYRNCPKGGTVLLSPAATSFATFVNEFDRGDQFNEIVRGL